MSNNLALTLRCPHVPGKPIILANVYDTLSARAVAELPSAKALATASYSVALAINTADDDLQLGEHLAALRPIAAVAAEKGKPLSIDFQDAYGEKLEDGVRALVQVGVVSINLEDCDKETQKMMPVEVAAERVERVLKTAEEDGVPDFVPTRGMIR